MEAPLRPAASTAPTKIRSLISTQKPRNVTDKPPVVRRSGGSVSGTPNSPASSRMAPKAARTKNIPRQVMIRVEITDHGPGDHQAGGPSQPLHEPYRNQHLDGRRKRAADGCQQIDRQADDQWRTPTEAVRQRPGDQLTDRQANQAGRNRQLGTGGRSLQLISKLR